MIDSLVCLVIARTPNTNRANLPVSLSMLSKRTAYRDDAPTGLQQYRTRLVERDGLIKGPDLTTLVAFRGTNRVDYFPGH